MLDKVREKIMGNVLERQRQKRLKAKTKKLDAMRF